MSDLRELATELIATHDRRLQNEHCMLDYGQAVERLRAALLHGPFIVTEPQSLTLELQAMQHVTAVLGSIGSQSARARVLLVVALALAPEVFSDREYGELLRRAKGA